jgi:hypothetical protein
MPDWKALIRQRLSQADLSEVQYDDVAFELASHLEEFYEEQRGQGVPDALAFEVTLHQIDAWKILSRRIARAKRKDNEMNRLTKTLWLPGFLTLLAWTTLIAAGQILRIQMPLDRAKLLPAISLFWLVTQPLLGALGAYISRRAGGTPVVRVVAGLFPALLLCATVIVVFVIRALVPPMRGGDGAVGINQVLLWQSVLTGIIVPGLALLLGTLPFLRQPASAIQTAS